MCTVSVYVYTERLALCCAGRSEFVQIFYRDLKALNPMLPILVREASGVTPKVYARYADGSEASFETGALDKDQIAAKLESIVVP